MKLVKAPAETPLYHLHCGNCKAVWECDPSELILQSDRDGTAYVLVCNHCTKETWYAVDAMRNFVVSRTEVT